MNLTKRERQFAEMAVKRTGSPFYRHHDRLGWIGFAFFAVGLFRGRIQVLPQWAGELLLYSGSFLFIASILGLAMSTTAKLYLQVQQGGLDEDGVPSAASTVRVDGRNYSLMAITTWMDALPWWLHVFLFPIFLIHPCPN